MFYDDLDNHVAPGRDIAQAAIPMGMLLTWAVHLHLVDENRLRDHAQLLLRIRFREVLGSALVIALGGNLAKDIFTPSARQFLDNYYPSYMDDIKGSAVGDIYTAQDDWATYELVSAVLTPKYMKDQGKSSRDSGSSLMAKAVSGLRRWWSRG